MIYYLEDDEQIRNLALYTLEQTGHATRGFSRAAEMDAALAGELPDLFLLDVMLPDEDGISVLKRLRADARTANVPIMMLTAKSTEFDTVCGLDAGADDYLAKPFGMMELISRVNALLRRRERDAQEAAGDAAEGSTLEVGPIRLDAARYRVTANGIEVQLTHKEFEMLHYLMENRGIVVSRDRLLERVWGYSIAGETRTVDAHVQTLRKKLSEACPDAAAYVETVRGVGYRLRA